MYMYIVAYIRAACRSLVPAGIVQGKEGRCPRYKGRILTQLKRIAADWQRVESYYSSIGLQFTGPKMELLLRITETLLHELSQMRTHENDPLVVEVF